MDGAVLGFVRSGGRVLLSRRSPSAAWRPMVLEGTDPPEERVTSWCHDELAREPTIVAIGDPIGWEAETAVPVLADVASRARAVNPNIGWRHPTIMDEASPGWDAYRRVAPSLDSILDDTEHGSSRLSLWALQVLRDRAATAGSMSEVRNVAVRLATGRSEMAVIGTRIDRVMIDASTPAAVHRNCRIELDRAVVADTRVGRRAGPMISDVRVLTLSRSGTVRRTLLAGEPDSITVLESRPGGEGESLAEQLAAQGRPAVVVPDAAVCEAVDRADVVLAGADTVDPDGTVANKLGTRLFAMAAEEASTPFLVVTTSDKIVPRLPEMTEEIQVAQYGSPDVLDTTYPLFDRTPGTAITAVVTERGVCDATDLQSIAATHRRNRGWRETS